MADRQRRRDRMRIVLTMPGDLVDQIDDYRFARRMLSRAAAIRELVEAGLSHRRRPRPSNDEPRS